MFSVKALKDVAERAVRTFAQAFLAVYGLDVATVLDTSLAAQAGSAGLAALVAFGMGLVGTKLGSSKDDASVR